MTTAIMLLINNRWRMALTVSLKESAQSISAEVFCVEYVNMMYAGEQESDAKKVMMYWSGVLAHFFLLSE